MLGINQRKPADQWITLDYLEFLCQMKHLVIFCRRGDKELCISPLGPHPSCLTGQEVTDVLRDSSTFEVRSLFEEPDWRDTYFLTRGEMEQQIRMIMN